jgi:dolichyl-phosphate-mannose--protein O-mannosyl transferase
MTRKDYWFAAGLAVFSLILCGIRYWYPAQAYFDEVYYPRSAAEYLQWLPQYEWTHPPLTKLLIALSMLLWGGMHSPYGNTGFGWRFLNVVVGALTVFLLYVFAKRLTRSTGFAAIAAALLVFDGFHFTQSRIATPEITVAFFSLFILYAFYRYVLRLEEEPQQPDPPRAALLRFAAISIIVGCGIAFGIVGALAHQSHGAVYLMASFLTLSLYAVLRLRARPRPAATGWLILLGVVCGLGAASKWNTLFDVIVVLGFAGVMTLLRPPNRRLPLDAFASVVLSITIALYLASYIPFFLSAHPVDFPNSNDLTGMMDLQNQMFTYHDVTVTHNPPHPYSSKWWEWPLLYQPIAYWYSNTKQGISEILSLPNPVTWWAGLLSVPLLGYLAWKERNKGYTLLFVAYFAQWLPWIASPRMLFQYHFFPNDAIILLADTIGLQWLWQRSQDSFEHRQLAKFGIGLFLLATVVMFAYFYPVLAGDAIPYGEWAVRMWFPHWIRGPG